MTSRRQFLAKFSAAMIGAACLGAASAEAFELQPYRDSAVKAAIASGKPVVVHVYASWCLQCHLQASILDSLKNDPKYQGVSFFRVDYDEQKDVVKKLDCPRSTLIAFRGGKEVSRMSWGVTEGSVTDVLKAAL